MIDLVQNVSLGILTYVSILYIISLILNNWSIIDIAWGPGFFIIALVSSFNSEGFNINSIIMLSMIALWAFRLSWHIGLRNIGKGEDFRYRNWRKKWIPYPNIQAFFRVFLLQGAIMFIVSLPIQINFLSNSESYNLFHHIPGILIFILGFVLEVLADWQLKSFKDDPNNKGRLIQKGLWSISRHPNYMGEITLWWGIGFYALPFESGWLALIGPLCIHLIMRYISIPVLEEKWEKRDDWNSIKNKTPILFPLK